MKRNCGKLWSCRKVTNVGTFKILKMSYTTNHEELIIDEEMGNETQSDAGAKMSTSSPSKNIKVDNDDEKEEAALQALLNEMDSEINKDIKQDENDKENEEFEQLSNGTPDGEVNADSADKIAAESITRKNPRGPGSRRDSNPHPSFAIWANVLTIMLLRP
ncbi:hypothetical protein evm_012265 [Chilo suppressalis]|nr:hypothetical protein evm_012265 [Chilo suppressalis]